MHSGKLSLNEGKIEFDTTTYIPTRNLGCIHPLWISCGMNLAVDGIVDIFIWLPQDQRILIKRASATNLDLEPSCGVQASSASAESEPLLLLVSENWTALNDIVQVFGKNMRSTCIVVSYYMKPLRKLFTGRQTRNLKLNAFHHTPRSVTRHDCWFKRSTFNVQVLPDRLSTTGQVVKSIVSLVGRCAF